MAYTAVTNFNVYPYLFLYCASFPTLSLLNNFYCDILHLVLAEILFKNQYTLLSALQ